MTDSPAHSPPGRWNLQVWLLALGMFGIGTDLFVISGLLPALGHDLGLSTAAAGQSVTAFAITYAVLAPVLASTTATLERRRLLVAVLTVFALGNLLSALATTYLVLLLSRVVTGAGAALFAATASAVAARLAPEHRRGHALAVVYGGMTAAIAFGVPMGNLIGSLSSWRWAFGFVATLALLAGLGLRLALPAVPGAPGLGIGGRLRVMTIKQAPSALACTTLWVVGTFVVYTYLGSILDQATHAPDGARTWLLLLFGLGSCLGVFAGGRLADRVDPTLGLAAGIAALVLVLIVLTWALHDLVGAAVGLTVWGAVHWTSFPLIQHRLLGIGRERGDTLLAVNNSAVYLGQTCAAAIGGALATVTALPLAPLVGAGCQILALGALLLGRLPSRRHPGPSATWAGSVPVMRGE